jgi:hypothetical protein
MGANWTKRTPQRRESTHEDLKSIQEQPLVLVVVAAAAAVAAE